MGQVYTVVIDAVASPAAIFDAFELNVPATRSVRILSVKLGQTSDVGDISAENLKVQLITGHATSGSGGSATTPQKSETGNAAAACTAETMNTTIASTGTPSIRTSEVWNTQLPYEYRPTPEEFQKLAPSERLVVRVSAPADAITMVGTLTYSEEG